MLAFLSKEKDDAARVTNSEIAFVSIPNTASKDEIKVLISQKAKLFADTLNLDTVYLHCGKDLIIYEYKV